MAGQLLSNFTASLAARAPDLAQAANPQEVESIVQEARTEAVARTAIPDTFVYRATVIVLGFAVVAVVLAQAWLTNGGKEIPEGLIAIGSAAIGALAGLLAPQPAS
jgi:hypothetical protein